MGVASSILRAMLNLLHRAAVSTFKPLASVLLALAATAAVAAPSPAVDPVPGHAARSNAAERTFAAVRDSSVMVAERVRDGASEMVSTAMNLVGVRYRLGGSSAETGFDCSGFTREVFEASVGLLLPRRADQQAKAPGLVPVKRDALQPGDLVFFNTLRRTFSHVGIYLGDGKFIHSPSKGGEVRVEDMNFAYWAKRFTGARRAEVVAEQAAAPTDATPAPAASFVGPLPTF